jgi:beta-lactamase superfamily II metal-dependent hydrolase/tetratricopeptide (TPR) repeat protein
MVDRAPVGPMLDSGVVVSSDVGPVEVRASAQRTRGAPSGEPDDFGNLVGALRSLDDRLEVVDHFDVTPAPRRRGEPAAEPSKLVVDVPASSGFSLLLVEDEVTGLWHWAMPREPATSEAVGATRFEVALARPATTRGVMGRLTARVVRIVVLKLGDALIAEGTERLAAAFEKRHRRGGLRWFTPGDYRDAKPEMSDQLGAADVARLSAGRSLLFLHGAFALSHTGFRRMPPELLARLGAGFDGRVWAYDHHTLSRTPRDNASDLVARLRELGVDELAVDVIAHDRGGLVARELVERPPDGSPLRIESVTFVGAANWGTPLCDEDHLAKLVDRITNLMAFIPDNVVTDVIDAVATVSASVACRAFAGLVGLTAMSPGGDYLEQLNVRRARPSTAYRAVVSNYEPSGDAELARKLRNLVSDHVFSGRPNDLIVPTDSAYRIGDNRVLVEEPDRVEFHPSQAVDHHGFWREPEFDRRITEWFRLPAARSPRAPGIRIGWTPVPAASAARSAKPSGPPQSVRVGAVHSSLECARHHVLVGHFLGSPIAGAEGYLDQRLDLRLSNRARLGLYPEQKGQSICVDTPRPVSGCPSGYPPGAIVVGLDRPGELTREVLCETVEAALLRQAIDALEHRLSYPPSSPQAGWVELRFSAVPIGTSGIGSMPIEGCVAALVDALILANQQLLDQVATPGGGRAWDLVRIVELEIVEHQADKAELVAHAVRRAADTLQADVGSYMELDLAQQLLPGEGGLPARPPTDLAASEWQRVIIRDPRREVVDWRGPVPASDDGTTLLEYTAVGRRARADRLEARVDSAAIESLVAAAIETTRPGEQVGNTLYELLLPVALKDDVVRIENLQLIVDEHTADFPWEALTARGVGDRAPELAVRGGLLRQFREYEGARHHGRPVAGNRVLVVGNPPAGEDLPPLSGARDEAMRVADVLGGRGYAVSGLVWNDDGGLARDDFPHLRGTPGRRVMDALFSQDWRIVHVASHGDFDPDMSSRSGAIIDQQVTVTANVVHQLPVVPELVFLNCCHLARTNTTLTGRPNRHRLAASVSRELMRIGVRAVVAAGWAVDDEAAAEFAETLYRRLLRGEFFGKAVHQARTRVRDRFPDSMTWAAFQCYGDPGYALEPPRAADHERPQLVSTDEVVRRLQTIRVLASKIGISDCDDITAREGELVDECHELRARLEGTRNSKVPWETPETLYELGGTYAQLGRYAEAVGCYRRAWNHPESSKAPVELLEQLGNLEIRLAQRRFFTSQSHAAADTLDGELLTVSELVREARAHLTLARHLGDAGERLALLGSFHKKAATMARSQRQQRRDLEAAARYYGLAHEWYVTRQTGDRVPKAKPYYALNWLQMSMLAGSSVPSGQAEPLLASIDEPAGQDYWARATAADGLLTRAVLDRRFDQATITELDGAYTAAFRTRSSRRERDSTIDHVRDIARLTGDTKLGTLAEALRMRWAMLPGGGAESPVPTEREAPDTATADTAAAASRVPATTDGRPIADTATGDTSFADTVVVAPDVAVPPEVEAGAAPLVIDMLRAGHGDCLVVSYGDPPHRILIDGGTAPSYDEGLAAYLERHADAPLHFDLFVVTHVDSDHIDGAVIFLQDRQRLGVEFDEIWFNGWPQLPPGRGPLSGEFLGALVPDDRWNARFGTQAVVLPGEEGEEGELPVVTLPGGATLTLLSPTPKALRRLKTEWEDVVEEAGFTPGDEQRSLELLAKRKALQPRARGARLYGGDNAVANGSSIAFLLEAGGRSCLLTGDAYAPVLQQTLDRLRRKRGVERLAIDAIKLSHHGSEKNVSADLLAVVDCRRYLVSTNGDYFKHPDPETLQLLAKTAGECQVWFNHDNDVVRRWETAIEPQLLERINATYQASKAPTTISL